MMKTSRSFQSIGSVPVWHIYTHTLYRVCIYTYTNTLYYVYIYVLGKDIFIDML